MLVWLRVAVKWTSPEAIETNKYSAASDVWSFGITVIEILLDGGKPYPGLANPAVLAMVTERGGYKKHPQPDVCRDAVYAVLLRCWAFDPADRPNFPMLAEEFAMLKKTSHGAGGHDSGDGTVVSHKGAWITGATRSSAGSIMSASSSSQGSRAITHGSPYQIAAAVEVLPQPNLSYAQLAETSLNAHAMAEAVATADTNQRCLSQQQQAHGAGSPRETSFGHPDDMVMEDVALEKDYGWRKPMDIHTIYEDVGRPQVMGEYHAAFDTVGSTNGASRGTNIDPSDLHYQAESPYSAPLAVNTVVRREL